MQLERQKHTDSVTRQRRLMVQPCFFVGNLMTAATPAAHGESLCLTTKEEVNTALGVNGLSRALKVMANM